ncbi:MAG: hypothetical protein JWN38_90 [Candidatus Saccharibacteria bacterium]|nr:hypothetical protein [Candidatus Saccharibacteria bacterium]
MSDLAKRNPDGSLKRATILSPVAIPIYYVGDLVYGLLSMHVHPVRSVFAAGITYGITWGGHLAYKGWRSSK